MQFGLTQKDIDMICNCMSQFPEITEAVIFGSRAIGNYKTASDIDIAIKGNNISDNTIIALQGILENDIPLPYRFDIIAYSKINNTDLTAHIQRVGKTLYHTK
ncbi:MAG: nucleotidyltransferase domain-containing protein [Phycisphaerae bacterium]|nr:nucleotidyltransferase domain-containing protein [Phycisphaerae bacterium]